MAIVVEIDPLDPNSGARVTLRLAASDDARLTGLNDHVWWPGIIGLPSLAMEAWDGDFTGAAQIASAAVSLDRIALRKNTAAAPSFRWAGAPLRVYEGAADAAWAAWETRFAGLVEDFGTDPQGRYGFQAKVDSEPFEASLLTLKYAGTGGAEGGDDLKDKVKPFCFGYARNVEPVMIDTVNYVFQVHGYGPIEGIPNVYEKAADFVENGGTNVGDYGSYAALVAADIPEGDYGTALAVGMFRLGAPPFGLITADVQGDNTGGWHRSTAEVILRLCDIADVGAGRIDSVSLAALETAVPFPINDYLVQPVKLLDYIQRLAQPCNAQAILSWTGQLQICRFGSIGTPGFTLDAQGAMRPPVLGVEEVKTSPPYWRIEMQGDRSHRVHTKDEIAFEDIAYFNEIYTRSPVQPATPTGAGVPAGWSGEPPGFILPTYGPVWRSTALSDEIGKPLGAWSTPVLTDSRYKGWVLDTTATTGLLKGATDALLCDAAFDPAEDEWPFAFIPQPMHGPFRLSFRVRGATDRVVVGVVPYDPGDFSDNSGDFGDVKDGFYVAQDDQYIVYGYAPPDYDHTDTTGVFVAQDFDFSSHFLDLETSVSVEVPVAECLYEMVWNGEVLNHWVNGDLVRSNFVSQLEDGAIFWPVFIPASPGAEIYDIVWQRATQAKDLEFVHDGMIGALRRISGENGWESYAPRLPGGAGLGYVWSKSFRGGGRLEAKIGGTSGYQSLSILALAPRGKIEFKEDGTFKAFKTADFGSPPDVEGTWVAGDLFAIQYSGKRVRMFKNGSRILKRKVGTGAEVEAYLEMGKNGSFYDIRLTPLDEEEFAVKGSVTDTELQPITDGSTPVDDDYIVVGEPTAIVMTVESGDEDEAIVSALMSYTNDASSAVSFTPDTLVQYSMDGGATYATFATTQDPGTAPTATAGGDTEQVTLRGTIDVTGTVTYLFRLVTKNSVAGAYSVALSGYITVEWQG
jgi:hypothetical protein